MTPEFTQCDLSIDLENQTVSESKGRSTIPTPVPSTDSELFFPRLRDKSLPCHSYEYMGGREGSSRVHISLNPQHLVFSPHRPLNPYAPSHTRYSPPKSLRAITYENIGGGGYAPRVHISLNLQHLVFRRRQAPLGNSSTRNCPRPLETGWRDRSADVA
jgi:hypothetical protein